MKAAMRAVKNSVMNYDDAEVRVREATSNDSWGAASQLMLSIAEDTNHRYRYKSTLDMINKRLTDYQHLNHVLKALILIEFLLRHGDMRFVQDMQDRKVVIRRLRGYKYYKDNKEIGSNVRKWANKVLGLLENPEELKKEREIAQKTKGKITGFSNDASPKDYGRQFEPEYKPEFKPDYQPDYKPDESASASPSPQKKKNKDDDESQEDPEEVEKPKKKKKGKKGKKKAADGEASSKKKKDEEQDEEGEEAEGEQADDTFDPDAFDGKDKKKPAKKASKKAVTPVESEDEEAPADNDGGAFQFDAAAEAEDFAFGFEDDPKNAKANPQRGQAKGAKAAADPDEFLFGIAAAVPKSSAPVNFSSVEDDTAALFDASAPAPKQVAPAAEAEVNLWDDLTNVNNLKDDPKQKKKPAAKKGGKTLNEIGGGSELVPFDLGAAATGAPSNALVPAAAPYDPMNPFAAPPVNPYAAAPNPWGQPPMANPYAPYGYGQPAGNPYAANPFGAPANPYAANPFGAPAPGPVNPFGMPAQPAPVADPFAAAPKSTATAPAKKDPFAEFSW